MTSSSDVRSLERRGWLGGIAGLAFVTLTLVGGVVQGDVPVFTDDPTAIKTWFADNSERYLVGACLIVLGALFFLAFLAALAATFVAVDERRSPWPWMMLLAGALVVAAAQTSGGFDATLALLEGEVSDDVARALSAGDYMTFLFVYPMSGITASAVSLAIVASDVLWRPLAGFGPVIAVGGLVALFAPLEHDAQGALTIVGYATLFAFLAWTAAVSVSMIVTRSR